MVVQRRASGCASGHLLGPRLFALVLHIALLTLLASRALLAMLALRD